MFATIELDTKGNHLQRRRFSEYSKGEDQSGLYRYLVEALNRNSGEFLSKHAAVMGETEERVKRTKTGTDHKQSYLLRLFERHQQKISRQCLTRNSYIRKGIDQYTHYYQSKHRLRCSERPRRYTISEAKYGAQARTRSECHSSNQNNSHSQARRKISSLWANQGEQCFSTSRRMYRADENGGKAKTIVVMGGQGDRQKLLNKSILSTKQSAKQVHINLQRQKTYEVDGSEGKNRRKINREWQQEWEWINGGYQPGHSNNSRRLISVGQKKAINDIQRMYLHNTLTVKHTPTVVVAQAQGYRPKTRRWLNNCN